MAFWHPAGLALCERLRAIARQELRRVGYREVQTPHLMRRSVWESSGHWQHFDEGMFKLPEAADDAALRPVNCPGHVQIYRQRPRSYRELPIRFAEFGVVHRREPSGALSGLFRLRQFTQDDGHVFCAQSQVDEELARFCQRLPPFYRRFGFEDVRVALSTRPERRVGDEAGWDWAEAALRRAAQALPLPFSLQPGEGAFYGPKLEFSLCDRAGRIWQCGTIQVDFAMPEGFDLSYVDSGGHKRRPVMLHRALYGSLERFLGVLLEHHGGALPAWMYDELVWILPVEAEQHGYAQELRVALGGLGVGARVLEAQQRLGARVSAARQAAAPFVFVVGPREQRSRSVSVRCREGERACGLSEALDRVRRAARLPGSD